MPHKGFGLNLSSIIKRYLDIGHHKSSRSNLHKRFRYLEVVLQPLSHKDGWSTYDHVHAPTKGSTVEYTCSTRECSQLPLRNHCAMIINPNEPNYHIYSSHCYLQSFVLFSCVYIIILNKSIAIHLHKGGLCYFDYPIKNHKSVIPVPCAIDLVLTSLLLQLDPLHLEVIKSNLLVESSFWAPLPGNDET